jgi:hypothetical protein
MDFNEFIHSVTGDHEDAGEQMRAILAHLVAGVEGDHITVGQFVESLNAVMHPDTSPLGLDIRPFFSVGAHLVGVPSLIDFFHSMYLVGIPGAYAVLCSHCAGSGPECHHPPARPYADMTSDDELMINKIFAAIFASVIPDNEEVEMGPEGMLIIKVVNPADKPELMDRMVDNFRREIDNEVETIVPDHEKRGPGDAGWQDRWMR